MTDSTDITLSRFQSLIDGFWWVLPNIGIAVVVFVFIWLAAWAASASISKLLNRQHRPDLAVLLAGFAKWALIVFGLLVVATIIFPSVKPADVLGALGVGSVAIGFAFKDILQNWLAGLLILLRQPFRQGDQIIVKQHEGTVERIEARATLIRTYDGRRVVIPNGDIYTEAVVVNTAFDQRRSEYEVGIGYGDDIEAASAIILETLHKLESVLDDPAPQVIPWELAGSTVNLKVRWWTPSTRSTVVSSRGEVIAAVKKALTEAGIDLPFPTRVLLFHDQTETADGDRLAQREGWPAGNDPPKPPARRSQDLAMRRGTSSRDANAARGSNRVD